MSIKSIGACHRQKINNQLLLLNIDRFLSIVQESSPEIEINKEKLKYFTSKIKIWDYFQITQQHFLSLSEEEKTAILKKYYRELESRQSTGKFG